MAPPTWFVAFIEFNARIMFGVETKNVWIVILFVKQLIISLALCISLAITFNRVKSLKQMFANVRINEIEMRARCVPNVTLDLR